MYASTLPCYRSFSRYSYAQVSRLSSRKLSVRWQVPTSRCYASTATKKPSRIRNVIIGTTIAVFAGFGYLSVTDTRSSLHQLAVPVIRLVFPDAEDAHEAGVQLLKGLSRFSLHPRARGNQDEQAGDLEIEVLGHRLMNPLGISAGLDKHGEIPTQLLAIGAGKGEGYFVDAN